MKRHSNRFKQYLRSSTSRLAGTYLAIIMVMSTGFSVAIYQISSQQLSRQLPPKDTSQNAEPTDSPPSDKSDQLYITPDELNQFLQNRIDEARQALIKRLVYLNLGAFALGSVGSYVLARRSLRPIEDAMEAQVQFVSDASHELKTPLTAIQASNEVFLRRPKQTLADAKLLIEQNKQDITRLQDLSNSLLSLAQHKASSVNGRSVMINTIVSDALTQVVPQATKKHLTVNDHVTDFKLYGDASMLTRVLVILLDNAVKYSETNDTIYISSYQHGKYGYIVVRDEGIGIRPADIPNLFRRFYRADNARTKGVRSGYGLGLAIAKQIIDNHHGTIEVDSQVGGGSTFTVKLPLATL